MTLTKGDVPEHLLNRVSKRHREVLEYFAGRPTPSNRDLADQLGLSEGTIKRYLADLYDIFHVADRTGLALMLVECGVNVLALEIAKDAMRKAAEGMLAEKARRASGE